MTENYERDINWSEIEARWQLENELKKWPRRAAVRGETRGCGARIFGCFLGGFMLFMFAIGLMLSFWAGFALLILPFGVEAPGTVTRHEMTVSSGRRTGTTSYFLHFRFAWNGGDYRGEWPVGEKIYFKLRDGDAVKVRCFPLAPSIRPMIEEGFSPWFHVWALGPLGLLMLGVSGLIIPAFLTPRSGKKLVKRGRATPGIVTRREWPEGGGNGEFWVLYRAEGQTLEWKQRLEKGRLATVSLGDVFTVLSDPKKPKRALVYRFCDFRAQG